MTDNSESNDPLLDSIEAQIQALIRQKEDHLKKKEEEKVFKMPNCKATIYKYSRNQVSIKCSVKRNDYVDVARSIPSRVFDWSTEKDIITISDYTTWKEKVSALDSFEIFETKEAKEYIEYYLNGPHAEITVNEKEGLIKIHPTVTQYSILGDLYPNVAVLHSTDSLYHIPKNELYRLLVSLKDYHSPDKIKWETDALEIAKKDLGARQLLDEVALQSDAPDFDIKFHGDQSLRPFQRVGVKFGTLTKETIGSGNIRVLIADEMGLGKTWQGIGICEYNKAKKVAIICPASVKENWRREILSLTGENARIMVGTQPSTYDLQDILTNNTRYFIFNYDILSRPIKDTIKSGSQITQKERYLWVEAINSLLFDHIILDEAHKFKNQDAARTKAVLRFKVPNIILLTGTPVLNRPLELWTGLHLLNPEAFNNHDGFKRRYTDGNYGVRNLKELRGVLRPYMIRRTKLDVQKDLPPIIRTTQHVEMSENQRKLYTKVLNSILVDLDTGTEKGEINHILTKILRLKQFLSAIKTQAVAEFAIELYDQADNDDPHKKVIVFSQFVPVVHRILRRLGNEARYIIGAEHKPEDRQLIVDEFQTNPRVQFLVATPQSTSEGLNITAAGHVIFCDFMWTPAVHQQAEGRAYGRLSDPHTIESHYFAVQNSLDDWLRGILMQKLTTIEAVIDGVQDQRMEESSIIKELIKALKSGEIK